MLPILHHIFLILFEVYSAWLILISSIKFLGHFLLFKDPLEGFLNLTIQFMITDASYFLFSFLFYRCYLCYFRS